MTYASTEAARSSADQLPLLMPAPSSLASPPGITGVMGDERPPASSRQVRDRFERQARRDTAPEMALRRELHRRGLRYRVDRAPIAGLRSRADVVFVRQRVAVFVDGCFWHGCPEHGTLPKSNAAWWADKLQANAERDRRVTRRLEDEGWKVIRAWEHEDPSAVADRIEAIIRPESIRPGAAGETSRRGHE